jgi:RNA polymerase sigma factor, sigma-70 family
MKDIEKEFVDIVEQNQRLIYKVCYIYTDNNDTLNDLYQDVMVNLWRGFTKFKGNSNISTWIYRIALNTCISYYRKERVKPGSVPISSNLNLYYDSPDNESISMMYSMIEALNPLDKAIILLYLEDKTYDEIAEIIGISKSNAGVRLLRIKEKLTKISNE